MPERCCEADYPDESLIREDFIKKLKKVKADVEHGKAVTCNTHEELTRFLQNFRSLNEKGNGKF